MPTVTVIQPIIAAEQNTKIRCAAYCRVSSDSENQLNSFMAQTRYYSQVFKDSETEELIDIYADEGITGTREDKRDEFQRMLKAGSTTSFPFSLIYPYGGHDSSNVPFSIRFFMLHRIFCEIEVDSSCARPPMMVIIISSVILAVSIFSFSKNIVIPRALSSRTLFRQSLVFLANRLIDFV